MWHSFLGHRLFPDHCVSRFRFYFRCAYINPLLFSFQCNRFHSLHSYPSTPSLSPALQTFFQRSISSQLFFQPSSPQWFTSAPSSFSLRRSHSLQHFLSKSASLRPSQMPHMTGNKHASPRVVRVNATPFPKQPLRVSWLPEETATNKTRPTR